MPARRTHARTILLLPDPPVDADHARAMQLAAGGTTSVEEAIESTTLSQSEIYRRMDSGELAWTKVGRRRLIFKLSLAEMLAKNARVQ